MHFPVYYINQTRTEIVRFDDARHLTKIKSNSVTNANFSENSIVKNCYSDIDASRIKATFSICEHDLFFGMVIKVFSSVNSEMLSALIPSDAVQRT